MVKKTLLILFSLSLCAGTGFAKAKGTSGAQFLKIVASPRAAAMGSAYTAIHDDANSIAFNPAGLSFLQKKEAVLVQNNWVQDISNQYIAAAMPIKNVGTLGLGVVLLTVNDMVRATNTGAVDGTKFGATDMAVTLAYATKLQKQTGVGLNLKMINQKIDDVSASGYAVDLGILHQASKNVALGFSVQHLGTSIKFINDSDPLPTTIKLGATYKPMKNLLCALDMSYPNDADISASIGAEYRLAAGQKLVFPVRVGYRSGYETENLSGLGAGMGVLYDNLLGVDMAWTPMGILGDSIKFGLTIKF